MENHSVNIYGLDSEVVDPAAVERTAQRFREQQIVLPTFSQLQDPTTAPGALSGQLGGVDRNAASPTNLWRIHWYNKLDGSLGDVPDHVVLTKELTGVDAPIVVAFGDRFPMIGAHKVLAAYGCLAPRLATGTFDPTRHRAIWPSTGNYCRGGVAVSRVMGCRGVAVLPEGMSRERFDWLEQWVVDESDIIKTPGTESNVKEIYDRCHELAQDPDNVILNQFCEFGNHIVHRLATGSALERVVEHLSASRPELKARAFVSATGSAGTIGAGDHLKERFGSLTVAVEALECPTLLYNGFGEHNIQGIGDKHVPLIHNVIGTDVVIAISDRATDSLNVLANTDAGRGYLDAPRRAGRDDRRARVVRPLELVQRAGCHQARQAAPPRGRRPRPHGCHRRRGHVPKRAGGRARSATGPTASRRSPRRRSTASTCSARARTMSWSVRTSSGTGSSTSATTPGSSSKGYPWRNSRPAANSASGTRCLTWSPSGTTSSPSSTAAPAPSGPPETLPSRFGSPGISRGPVTSARGWASPISCPLSGTFAQVNKDLCDPQKSEP